MDALQQPLERVVEAGEWFVRTPTLRLLHVMTTNALRIAVLEHLVASEQLDAAGGPMFVLEAACEPGDDGWALRCDELRADWEGLVATAPAELALPPSWPAREQTPASLRFQFELASALALLREPMRELFIVLAPVWVRDAQRWQTDLAALLGSAALAKARFVVVEVDEFPCTPLVAALGSAAEQVDARVDDASLREQMAARVAAMTAAPAGAMGLQLTGAAGPTSAPPPRPKARPPLSPAQRSALAAEVGVPGAYFEVATMQSLRVLVMSAATTSQTNPSAAIELQRRARDLCVEQGLVKEAVVNELVLAGYVLQAGQARAAMAIFEQARARAEAAALPEQAVQAQLAIGSCLLVDNHPDQAIAAYGEAGRLGADAGATVFAIEGYRMMGQLSVARGRTQDGANAFWRALELANQAPTSEREASSASSAARALAKLCRQHGLTAQADALDAQAGALEAS